MNRLALSALIACVLLLGACASKWLPLHKSEESCTTKTSPVTEKKDPLMAIGYAVISVQNSRNPAEQRLLAMRASKLDAYRALAEQVYGQQLDANTTVADMAVTNDTFRTRVEGVIYGAVLVSITPVGEDSYETTLSLDRQVVNDLRAQYLSSQNGKSR